MPRIPDPSTRIREEIAEHLDDEGRLDCPTCRQIAKPAKVYGACVRTVDEEVIYPRFSTAVAICAACGGDAVFIRKWSLGADPPHFGDREEVTEWNRRVSPMGIGAKRFPNTPVTHRKAYEEACLVADLSPASSACMSRRCLQGILAEQGYSSGNLAKQIDGVLGETDPRKLRPVSLHECVDAIRGFGNFAAHPISDLTTLQVIEVEPGEAEWCIEISEQLMDHYFERPHALRAKIDAANAKFGSGGKPPLKT